VGKQALDPIKGQLNELDEVNAKNAKDIKDVDSRARPASTRLRPLPTQPTR
jgi:hypothetical protein